MTSILKVSEIQPTTTGNLIQLPTVPFVHVYGASSQTVAIANATTTVVQYVDAVLLH